MSDEADQPPKPGPRLRLTHKAAFTSESSTDETDDHSTQSEITADDLPGRSNDAESRSHSLSPDSKLSSAASKLKIKLLVKQPSRESLAPASSDSKSSKENLLPIAADPKPRTFRDKLQQNVQPALKQSLVDFLDVQVDNPARWLGERLIAYSLLNEKTNGPADIRNSFVYEHNVVPGDGGTANANSGGSEV